MAEQKIYTAKDLSRYHSGEMSAAEMHALEKAALADPFLADALEGYAYAETPENDLAQLTQQITEKQSRRKIFFLSPRADKGWLRIAAVLIVFAGAAYMFYRFNEHAPEQGLATNEIKQPLRDTPATAVVPLADSSIHTETLTAIAPQKKQSVTSSDVQTNSGSVQYYTATSTATSSAIQPSGYKVEKLLPAADSTTPALNGIVAADQEKPVKRVLKSLHSDEQVSASGNNNAGLVVDDKFKPKPAAAPVVNAVPATRDFAQTNAKQSNTDRDNLSSDKDDEKSLSQESDANMKENRALLRKGISGKSTSELHGRMEPIDSVVFIDYAAKNMKPVYKADSSELKGKVVLSFTVNRKGQPENIKVEKSVCKACDEQAVSLLKNGPHWIYVAGKVKQVTLEYKAAEPRSDQ